MQAWVCLRCRIWWRTDKFGDLENSRNNHDAGQCTGSGLTIRPVLPVTAAKENQPQAMAQKDYDKVKSIEIEQYVCPFCLQADALFKVDDEHALIDGWGCHRCRTVQLRDAEYADLRLPVERAAKASTAL